MDQTSGAAHSRLDRAGRASMVAGALVVGMLAVLLVLFASWFITYFSDGSAERGLAAIGDVWLVWLIALALIAVAVVALAWMVRGGNIALVAASIGGTMIAAVSLLMLMTGHDRDLRWTLILAGAIGGLALAAGAIARLAARPHRAR